MHLSLSALKMLNSLMMFGCRPNSCRNIISLKCWLSDIYIFYWMVRPKGPLRVRSIPKSIENFFQCNCIVRLSVHTFPDYTVGASNWRIWFANKTKKLTEFTFTKSLLNVITLHDVRIHFFWHLVPLKIIG